MVKYYISYTTITTMLISLKRWSFTCKSLRWKIFLCQINKWRRNVIAIQFHYDGNSLKTDMQSGWTKLLRYFSSLPLKSWMLGRNLLPVVFSSLEHYSKLSLADINSNTRRKQYLLNLYILSFIFIANILYIIIYIKFCYLYCKICSITLLQMYQTN